jgi:hypothetical protein
VSILDTTDDHPFDPPLALAPGEVYDEMLAAVQAAVPGFRVLPGQGYGHILQAVATVAAEGREAFVALMVDRLTALLADLHQVPALPGRPASSTITVRAADAAGHTLEAGSRVFLDTIALELVSDLTVPAGETEASVAVQATTPGAAINGATGNLELDEPQDWIADVDGVVLDAPLTDGEDPEGDVAHAARLREDLTIQSGRPILPRDFAVLARRHPSAKYAWPVNLLDPAAPGVETPGHVAIVVTDEIGEALGDTAMQEIAASLTAAAGPIVGITVHVLPPAYTTVDITAEVVFEDGFPALQVLPAVKDMLRLAVSPSGWIERLSTRDVVDAPAETISDHQLIMRLRDVEGVKDVPALLIGDGTSTTVTLEPRVGLPRPGVIDATEAP